MTPKVLATEYKINWIVSKLKFCASKGTIKKVKRQSTEWEKIRADTYLMRLSIENIQGICTTR